MSNQSLFVDGIVDDVINLNNLSFIDVCTIYPYLPEISNGQGGSTEGFDTPLVGVPCRVDDTETNLLPERAKDNIDVEKVERVIYVPVGTIVSNRMVDIKDEIETNAGSPTGSIIRYRVLDVIIETQETDIAFLVEVVY